MTKQYLNLLEYQIIGAAIRVHRHLGPGLLESIYHKCLLIELNSAQIPYESERMVPIKYQDAIINGALFCDLLVEKSIVVEIKATSSLLPINEAQLLEAPMGILINFNVTNIFHKGKKTLVNTYFSELPD